jgi:hypothetical protein
MSKALGVAGAGLRLAGVVILCALASCGGGNSINSIGALTPPATWPVHNYEGAARSGSFAAVAVDSTERSITPLTSQLSLTVRPESGGTLVSIRARELTGLSTAYLHLKYDNTQLHPVLTRSGEWLPSDTVFLGMTNVPGLVTLGLTTAGGRPVINGDQELAAVRFEPGPYLADRRASVVSTTAVTDLHFDALNKKQLTWTYASKGDYDQNSEVGVSDITPIGIHLHKTTQSPTWAAAQCADGDGNGEVAVTDLQPIGANYRKSITAYQVKGGSSETGPFSNDEPVMFNSNTFPIPEGGGFRQFSYTVDTAVDGAYYVVVPLDGSTESTAVSNAVQYHAQGGGGSQPPPQNLSAAANGLSVRLTWQAPTGGTPTGYNTYVASGANMTGALKMNTGNGDISGLQYDCPLSIQVDGTYYFAVRAVYSGVESVNSNIYGYNIVAGTPTGLAATQQGNLVQLTWVAPAGTPPDGYNAYLGNDAAMSGAQRLNLPLIPTSSYDCPLAVDPAQEHYFAVKAVTSGVETAYSNICHYTSGGGPGDTTPPVWQQNPGIKSATPNIDGGSVQVAWNIATDADSPPVRYQLFVVPDGQPVDWNDPADDFASTITSTVVNALGDGTPFQDGHRYTFAVRAYDAVVPPNVTTNVNTLSATPQILPPTPTAIPPGNPLLASDTASVRIAGEEVPRMVAVNHATNLYYVKWNAQLEPPDWTVYDLNTSIGVPGRKYHPQLVAIGDEVHLLFATADTVYEAFGPKDSPETWQLKTVASALSSNPGVTGTGLVFCPNGNYLACVYSASSGGEQLWYSDRDLTASGEWSVPLSIMNGSTQIWQCDLAINPTSGEQWAVAANGSVSSQDDKLKFWYTRRVDRNSPWDQAKDSGFGGDVMTVDIDPANGMPIVACAEVTHRTVDLAGEVPVSDATIFTWTGNAWAKNTLETGDAIFDQSNFSLDTILTGQDPQIVFSPAGKTIALWSNLDFFTDLIESEATLTGDWRYSQRPTTTWSPPQSLLVHISSSNSVTAGDSFQHCLTCDLGLQDSGGYQEIADKYSKRNDYVEGQLYYLYKAWN